MLVGVALIGWILVQVAVLGWPPHWLQVLCLAWGVAVLALALRLARWRSPRRGRRAQ